MKKIFLLFWALAACSPQDENFVNGYIEGTYVYISPYTGGILDEIKVSKGKIIKTGDRLFIIDKEIWNANIQQATYQLDKAYANYANLSKGKRKQELEIILKQKAQAEAEMKNTKKEYERAKNLVKTQIISQSDFDQKLSDFQQAKAKVEELEASLQTAMLSAREDELEAAQKDIEIARQNLVKVKQQAANNTVYSKVGGQIENTYFRLGEYVPAGSPVVSILPPENVKIRFFVSEKLLAKIKLKTPVTIYCDGCKQGIPAKVSFISPKSEFTPPVIYSAESREKLVFMIEALFDDKAQNLRPGLPVSVKVNIDE